MKTINYFFTALALTAFLCAQNAVGQTWTDQHMFRASSLSYDGSRLYKNAFYPQLGVALYVSDDEGGTWTELDAGLSALTTSPVIYIAQIFPTSTGRLITSLNTGSGFKIIYSDNQGISWTETSDALNTKMGSISETNGTIYARGSLNGDTAVYSTDNGATWDIVPSPYAEYPTIGADNGEFYVFTGDSLITLNSSNFSYISGYPTVSTSSQTRVFKNFGQHFFHIFYNGGLHYSSDKQNWTDIRPGSANTTNAYDVFFKEGVIYTAANNGHKRSSDFGDSYTDYGSISGGLQLITLTDNYIVVGDQTGTTSGSTYRMNYSGVSEVTENELSASVNIYPNPTTEAVTITDLPVGSTVYVIDLTGKVVYSTATGKEQTTTINTADFTSGIYLIRIESNGNVANRKLVVNK